MNRIWVHDEDSGRDILLGEQVDEPPVFIDLVDNYRKDGHTTQQVVRLKLKSSWNGDYVYEQYRRG